jgi:hypothetical protein
MLFAAWMYRFTTGAAQKYPVPGHGLSLPRLDPWANLAALVRT